MSERRVQMWIRRRPLQQVPSLGNWSILASPALPAKWAGVARVVVFIWDTTNCCCTFGRKQVREARLHINVNDSLPLSLLNLKVHTTFQMCSRILPFGVTPPFFPLRLPHPPLGPLAPRLFFVLVVGHELWTPRDSLIRLGLSFIVFLHACQQMCNIFCERVVPVS